MTSIMVVKGDLDSGWIGAKGQLENNYSKTAEGFLSLDDGQKHNQTTATSP